MRHSKEFIGETPGTFLLVLFGCGSIAVSVLFNAGLAIYVLFSPSVAAFENAHNIFVVRLNRFKLPRTSHETFIGSVRL